MNKYRLPPRENKSSLWLILGIVGGLVLVLVLICGGVIYVVSNAIRGTAEAIRDAGQQIAQLDKAHREQEALLHAQQTALEFLDNCVAGRTQAAYQATTAAFQKRLTLAAFTDLLAKHPAANKGPLNPIDVQPVGGAQQYRLSTQTPAGAPIDFTVTMAREADNWKVDELAIDGPEKKK
jgi:hypothetical protein